MNMYVKYMCEENTFYQIKKVKLVFTNLTFFENNYDSIW